MPFRARQPSGPVLVGVVHLLPLPGAPRPSPGLPAVLARAVSDAEALIEGGVDGIVVENYGDAPFSGDRVDPWTIAAMTRLVGQVREVAVDRMLGVNVLRNDARAALAVAEAVGADFIRVNVHTGTMVTDQGLITGEARATLLERNRLGSAVAIAADVHVKHGAPLGAMSLEQAARDAWSRGGADVLIVTGPATGVLFDPIDLHRIRQVAASAPLWVGSGLTPETANAYRDRIEGAIVGTWFHADGIIENPVDVARVRALRDALA